MSGRWLDSAGENFYNGLILSAANTSGRIRFSHFIVRGIVQGTMSQTTQTAPSTANTLSEAAPVLAWSVHLVRRAPHRLPGLVMALFLGAGCVWMMFQQILPVLAAVILLLGSCADFLFPIRYRLNAEGLWADGLTSRLHLGWKEARRCVLEPRAVTVTPLPAPSRLDAFRGVTLRFAPSGEPGDRASVLEALRSYVPTLLPTWEATEKTRLIAEDGVESGEGERA